MDVNSNDISRSELLIQQVLSYISVEDLFSCSDVNAVWKACSLSLLRKKLKYVRCSSIGEDDAAEHSFILQDFCSKIRRYRRIAVEASQKPTLIFLMYRSSWKDDRNVADEVLQCLPKECIAVFFKMKPAEVGTIEKCYDGLEGVVLFRVFCRKTATAQKGRRETRLKMARSRSRTTFQNSQSGLNRVSGFLRRLMFGHENQSLLSCFKNTSRGVMTFQSRLNVPQEGSERITTYYVEKWTGKKLEVTTTSLLGRLRKRSVECILSLKENFENVENTITVLFQSDPSDTFVTQHLQSVFQHVPVVCLGRDVVGEVRSIASDGSVAPADERMVLVMVLRLVPNISADKGGTHSRTGRDPVL